MTDAAYQRRLYEAQRSTASVLEYWIARSRPGDDESENIANARTTR